MPPNPLLHEQAMKAGLKLSCPICKAPFTNVKLVPSHYESKESFFPSIDKKTPLTFMILTPYSFRLIVSCSIRGSPSPPISSDATSRGTDVT